MCQFFSAIATRDGRLLFTEDDSHETIVERAKLRDDDLYLRHWIRIEARPSGTGWGPVTVDESSTPEWWIEDRPAKEAKILALADRVRKHWEAYVATERPAREAYVATRRTAREAYEATRRTAWEAYEATERPAREAYVSHLSRIAGYCAEAKQ